MMIGKLTVNDQPDDAEGNQQSGDQQVGEKTFMNEVGTLEPNNINEAFSREH